MSATAADRTSATPPIDEVRPTVRRHVLRIGSASFLVRPRVVAVGVMTTVVALVLFSLSVGTGDYPLSPLDVGRILLGGGTRVENVVVFDVALPRALISVLVGIGFGASGALTQTIARNPLATPDVLGITAGAGTAAVAAIAFGSSWGSWFADIGIPAAALVGGALAAALMYLLAWRGGIDAFRLVLIGVALTWVFQALTGYALTRAAINDVGRAQRWLVGSVSDASWSSVVPVAITLAVAAVVLGFVNRAMSTLSLGRDMAQGLGVRADPVSALGLVVAVAMAAICVSAAGPIAFVALLAPQIALRIARVATPPPLVSGLIGAVLVVGGDLLCRHWLPDGIPVGVVTAGVGGPFLIYLMIAVSRKASA